MSKRRAKMNGIKTAPSRNEMARDLRRHADTLVLLAEEVGEVLDRIPGQKLGQVRQSMAQWAETLFGCSIRVTLGIAEIIPVAGELASTTFPLFEIDNTPEPAQVVPEPIAPAPIITQTSKPARRKAVPVDTPQPEENGHVEPIEEPDAQEKAPPLPPALAGRMVQETAIVETAPDGRVVVEAAHKPVHELVEAKAAIAEEVRTEQAKYAIVDQGEINEITESLVEEEEEPAPPPPPRRRPTPPPAPVETKTWLVYPKGRETPVYALQDTTEESAEERVKESHPVGYGFDIEEDTTDFARRTNLYRLPTRDQLASRRAETDDFMAGLAEPRQAVADDPEELPPTGPPRAAWLDRPSVWSRERRGLRPTGPPRAAWLDRPVTVLDLVKRELDQLNAAGITTLERIHTLAGINPEGFKDEEWSAIVGEMRTHVREDLKARQERGDDIEEELIAALVPDSSAAARWNLRRENPRTDDEIKEMFAKEWGGETNSIRYGFTGHVKRGGKNPAIWVGVGVGAKPTLTGSTLVNRVRTLLQIPKAAKVPKGKKASSKTFGEEYALDYEDDAGSKCYSVIPGTLANAEKVAETIRTQGYTVRIRPMNAEIETEIEQAEEGEK